MLIRDARRLSYFIAPAIILLFIVVNYRGATSSRKKLPPNPDAWKTPDGTPEVERYGGVPQPEDQLPLPPPPNLAIPLPPPPPDGHDILRPPEDAALSLTNDLTPPIYPFLHEYTQIFSNSVTTDRSFFKIDFGEVKAINPNIIPYPKIEDAYIVVAQEYKVDYYSGADFIELVCTAKFKGEKLECLFPPTILPVAPTPGGEMCTGNLDFIRYNIGPHDARVFQSPTGPYIFYGSNSQYTCFSQWMQSLRALLDWDELPLIAQDFAQPTEIQRPPPYRSVEKNWFPFWDYQGHMYVHYDIAPARSFAKLELDGSVGEDLALNTADKDAACLAKLPPPVPHHESIHQATNSLAITLCTRRDKENPCKPSDENTFIFTIFHHKQYYDFHGDYDPYVMLFRQKAPFDIYGISKKPIWISGRGTVVPRLANAKYKATERHSEMLYVTSINWKDPSQKYHGYIDDLLFITFGIEDQDTAGIDIMARDILGDDLIDKCGL